VESPAPAPTKTASAFSSLSLSLSICRKDSAVDGFVLLFENIEDHPDSFLSNSLVFADGLDGDARRLFVGKAEFPGGNAAKRHASQPFSIRKVETGPIAGCQVLPILSGHMFPDDRPHGMEHIAAGQIERGRDLASPVGSSCPWRSMISSHADRS